MKVKNLDPVPTFLEKVIKGKVQEKVQERVVNGKIKIREAAFIKKDKRSSRSPSRT
jgi:hypothetical protein